MATAKVNPTPSCPRHGIKFIFYQKGICYCTAPTPGELSSKCFYHPTAKGDSSYLGIDTDKIKPDVMKLLRRDLEVKKRNKIRDSKKYIKKDGYVPTEIRSQKDPAMAGSRNSRRKDGTDKTISSGLVYAPTEDEDDLGETGDSLEYDT